MHHKKNINVTYSIFIQQLTNLNFKSKEYIVKNMTPDLLLDSGEGEHFFTITHSGNIKYLEKFQDLRWGSLIK